MNHSKVDCYIARKFSFIAEAAIEPTSVKCIGINLEMAPLICDLFA